MKRSGKTDVSREGMTPAPLTLYACALDAVLWDLARAQCDSGGCLGEEISPEQFHCRSYYP